MVSVGGPEETGLVLDTENEFYLPYGTRRSDAGDNRNDGASTDRPTL